MSVSSRMFVVGALVLATACSAAAEDTSGGAGLAVGEETPSAAGEPSPSPAPSPSPTPAPSLDPSPQDPYARPDWLGTRVLPTTSDGFGEVQPTPQELRDRRLATIDVLPPPATTDFTASIEVVPDHVAARSTWSSDCPVPLDELRYVTVSFWGFDQRHHTGELLVNAAVAEDVVEVFRRAHQARFPVEEMRVVAPDELDAPPTGDGNNTTAFVCRPSVGSTSWSEHAYGLAVDVNPFHNPYLKGDVVLPELAPAYTDRSWERPGMILSGDAVTQAFAAIGWGWGGDWRSAKDWMHFSSSGR